MKYSMTICADAKVEEMIVDSNVPNIEENFGFAIGSEEHMKFVEKQVRRCIEQCFDYKVKSVVVKAFDVELIK